jgi:hypothetical protein
MGQEKMLGDELLALDGLSNEASRAMVDRVRQSIQVEAHRMRMYRLVVGFWWIALVGIWIGAALFVDPGKAYLANLPWFTAGAIVTGIVAVLTINYEGRRRRLTTRRLEGRLLAIEQQLLELRRGSTNPNRDTS